VWRNDLLKNHQKIRNRVVNGTDANTEGVPMTEGAFVVIASNISATSEAPKGRDIYYRCKLCGDAIPSQPKLNIGCKCGNVFIDVDYFRLSIEDYSKFEAVKKASPRK
jgi:hypothetical protein